MSSISSPSYLPLAAAWSPKPSKTSFSSHRLVQAASADAFERGVALARVLQPLADELHSLLSNVWFSHLIDKWDEMAVASYPTLKKYCPVAFAELQGYASVLDKSEEGRSSIDEENSEPATISAGLTTIDAGNRTRAWDVQRTSCSGIQEPTIGAFPINENVLSFGAR